MLKNKTYFRSVNVIAFPCAYRGQYEDPELKVTKVFDPEARLASEHNYASKLIAAAPSYKTNSASANSYVVSFTQTATDTYSLEMVIGGYYFKVNQITKEMLLGDLKDNPKFVINRTQVKLDDTSVNYTYILGHALADNNTFNAPLDNTDGGTDVNSYYFYGLGICPNKNNSTFYTDYLVPFAYITDDNDNVIVTVNADAINPRDIVNTGDTAGFDAISTRYLALSASNPIVTYPYTSFNIAKGQNAIALGCQTEALGTNSITAGINTKTNTIATNSVALGAGTVADTDNQLVTGSYNKVASGDCYVIIGDGTSSANKSNILELLKTGTLNLGNSTHLGNVHIKTASGYFDIETSGQTKINNKFVINADGSFSINSDKFKVLANGNTTINNDVTINGSIAHTGTKFKTTVTGTDGFEVHADADNNFKIQKIGDVLKGTTITLTAASTATNAILLNGNTQLTNKLKVNDASTGTLNGGAVQVVGGAYIAKDVYIGQKTWIKGELDVTQATILQDTATITKLLTTNSGITNTGTFTTGSGAVSLNDNTTVQGTLTATGETKLATDKLIVNSTGVTIVPNMTASSATFSGTLTANGAINLSNDFTVGARDTGTESTKLSNNIGITDLNGPTYIRTKFYSDRAVAETAEGASTRNAKNAKVDLVVGTAGDYYKDNTYAAQFNGPVAIAQINDKNEKTYQKLYCGAISINGPVTANTQTFNMGGAISAIIKDDHLKVTIGTTTGKYDGSTEVDEADNGKKNAELVLWGSASIDNEISAYTATIGDKSTGGSKVTISSGNVTASGAIKAKTFGSTSDIRKKTNITEYTPSKSILDLPLHTFEYIDDNSHTKYVGCIAQDLEKIAPELIFTDDEGYLSIQENKLVYLLINEVKQLKSEVEKLRIRLKD